MALVLAAGAAFADEEGEDEKPEIEPATLTFKYTVKGIWHPHYYFRKDSSETVSTTNIFDVGEDDGKITASYAPGKKNPTFHLVDGTYCNLNESKKVTIEFKPGDNLTLEDVKGQNGEGAWMWHCDGTGCDGPSIHFTDDENPLTPENSGDVSNGGVSVTVDTDNHLKLNVVYPSASCNVQGHKITDRRSGTKPGPVDIALFTLVWGEAAVAPGEYTATMTVTFSVT